MNNNRKLVKQEKGKISDEDVLRSSEFSHEMQALANGVCLRIKKKPRVRLIYDPKRGVVAKTDGENVLANISNELTSSLPNLATKARSITGLIGHECGHILYSDMRAWTKLNKEAEAGVINDPGSFLSEEDARNFLEMAEAIKKSRAARVLVAKTVGHVGNALEDQWMEDLMCQEFPGSIRDGIQLNAFRMFETSHSVQVMMDQGLAPMLILYNLVLQYARFGKINNWEGISNEFTDFIREVGSALRAAVAENDFYRRNGYGMQVIAHMWPVIKKEVQSIENDSQPQKQDEGQSSSPQSQDADGAGAGQAGSGQSGEDSQDQSAGEDGSQQSEGSDGTGSGKEAGAKKKESKKKGSKPGKKGKGNPSPDADPTPTSEELLKALVDAMNQAAKDSGESDTPSGDFSPMNAPAFNSSENNGPEKVRSEEGGRFTADNEEAIVQDAFEEARAKASPDVGDVGDAVERMRNKMAEAKALEKLERENEKRLNREIQEMKLPDLHRVRRTISRIDKIPPEYVEAYQAVYPLVHKTASRLAAELSRILHEDDETEDGLIFGKRLSKDLYRMDGRIFSKENLPDDGKDLAVALVIDESASMAYGDRITSARLTALVMYDFCQILGIPVCIYGHCVNSDVQLHSYADFDAVDGNDKYRLMGIHPSGCNRDGLALRFVGDKLAKRPETSRILIMISDGQPNDTGYRGDVAKRDLRDAKLSLAKRGVVTFAAAIGDDREVIRSIYGNGFLNISDLKQLPRQMVRLVEQYIHN